MCSAWRVQILALVAVRCLGVSSQTSNDVIVMTRKGPIAGLRVHNPKTGASYDAFLGIPYGKTPKRFQLAVPPDPWTPLLKTQTDGPTCPQGDRSVTEDCLYLNVFTPVGTSTNKSSKLSVMVFVHGGAFKSGSSTSLIFGPDFLVSKDVILVAMNYRLGALGFATLGTKKAPGNLGLTDILLSLRWVQDEIAAFGGDPTSVTLFGQSAGAILTQQLYLSRQTKGLFVGAISQSGTAANELGHVTKKEGERRTKVLAKHLGCDVTLDDSQVLKCLQQANVSDILARQNNINLPLKDLVAGSNGLTFLPVLDCYQTADRPIFDDSLDTLIAQAASRGRPLMDGWNTEEGVVKFQLDDYWKQAEANLDYFIPRKRQNSASNTTKAALAEAIRQRFFPHTPDLNKVVSLVKLYTEKLFICPSIKTSRKLSNITYGYIYSFHGGWSIPRNKFPYPIITVAHGDELPYLFYTALVNQPMDTCSVNRPNLQVNADMVRWWTTFAKTGSPGPDWMPLSEGKYRKIDSPISTKDVQEVEEEHYKFCEAIEQCQSLT
uniref:Carboxylic ester hydrolase n=1 Tax=Graphocephala atropunctata TaxID=36148 RepID=A0A1B6M5R2_9HEMI